MGLPEHLDKPTSFWPGNNASGTSGLRDNSRNHTISNAGKQAEVK